ncbi:hypothetical protein PIB30_034358 [Stylosanthes scabra]|uniref:TMV resistance protein N n=1 Tax=Stylosanthes scabra TaxID=79078 RepID=A0ABU6VAT8_9FABA|nr:hypothetical protein [Stylosanthes scabra]
MGGIGKSTLATALYDRISYQFHASCFVENVTKLYKDGGAMAIQKQILRQSLVEKNLDTYSPSEISGIIANRVHNLKVLIVLDNVNQLKQLEELAINPKLLCEGSRIIITTRDEHILKAYGADEVHNVPLLSEKDAEELLSRKAFKRDCSSNNYEELIPKVLKYAQRHPLTIRVVGSFLCSRSATQWRDALDRLRNNLEDEITEVLRISYERLQFEEKVIFLHIACFFRGEREDYVKRILHACGLHPHIGIPVIAEKSLITIRNQEIHMHEMLQDLGKKIVREKSPQEPGSWSRIWSYKDFHRVLIPKRGTNETKGIVLDVKEDIRKCNQLNVEELSKMVGLTLLIIHQENYSGSLNTLSNCLEYLWWHGYPFPSLPLKYEPFASLVELNLPGSSIQRLWEGRKSLVCLRRVDLSNSKELMETPNFEWCTNLKRLDLSGCTNLQKVHPSIGLLERLVYLNLRDCNSLVSLNFGDDCKLHKIGKYARFFNLEYLDLEKCTSLAKLHESVWALGKLRSLSLRGCTRLKEGPDGIGWMASLQILDFQGCSKLSELQLVRSKNKRAKLCTTVGKSITSSLVPEALTFLNLGFSNIWKLPDDIGELRGLERLNLQGSKFCSLPDTIGKLSSLAYLNLEHCFNLSSLPRFPFINDSSGGRYLKTISRSRNQRSGLYLFNCRGINKWCCLNWAFVWLTRLIEQPCHFRCGFDIVIPGDVIPPCEQAEETFSMKCNLDPEVRDIHGFQTSRKPGVLHLWIIYVSRPHCRFVKTGANITFKTCPGIEMKNWGLRMVFKQDIEAIKSDLQYLETSKMTDDFYYSMYDPKIQLHDHRLVIENVHVSSSSRTGPKIQLPYNWYVTEEEEKENMEAKDKEINLANIGL